MAARRNMKSKKGQVALETLIVVGFVLALMTPLLYMLYSRINEIQQEMFMLEATRAVDTIVTTVSTVGSIGPNGTATIELSFPPNMKNLSIGGTQPNQQHEVVMVVSTNLGDIDIPRVLFFNVTESGLISRKSGTHKVTITYPDTGVITISPA